MAPSPVRPASVRTRWRALAEILVVAALYGAASRLALEFLPGAGRATAVWPASGLALAVVLLLGSRVWPGIALGSLAVGLGALLAPDGSTSDLVTIATSCAIALAAAAQALVGAAVVRRHAGYPNTLANGSDVLRFLVLAGPVCGLIRPAVGVLSLSIGGAIPPGEILATFGIAWAGDSFGTALFAPLVLLGFDGSVLVRWRRKIFVTVPLLLTFALTVVLFEQVGARERDRERTDFELHSDELARGLHRAFDASLDSLESLGGFFDAAERIDRRQFASFARNTLARVEGVRAIAWIPRVKDSERKGCLRAGRLEVAPGFDLLERGRDGAWTQAEKREEYAPTFYLEPPDEAEWKLGADGLADPVQREALARARDTGEPSATPPAPIAAPKGPSGSAITGATARHELGFFVYRPVYGRGESHDSVTARRTSVVGYAAGLFLVPDLVRAGLAGAETGGLRVELVDVTHPDRERQLLAEDAGAPRVLDRAAPEPAVRTNRYTLGGRTWELRFERSEARPACSWQAWAVLAGGLLFTGLLGAFLLVITGRADAIEELVARRTKEIERANASLRHEIGERARAEAEHQKSEARLAAAQQIAHLGSWELDLSTNRFLWSDELCRIHGLPASQDRIDFATFLSHVHFEDRQFVDLSFGAALRDRRPFGFRYRIVRPDGGIRTLDGRGDITLDPATGTAIRMNGTGQDVTELEQAEKELADRTVELERTNAELERFAYVASHDLQEPLRAVASHVQILQEDYQGKLDADADESIRCAVDGARRMRDLIHDYLAYSRVRIGADPQEKTSSGAALALALDELSDRLRECRARVTHDELPEVIADPSQLQELFKNLVGNAVKFRRAEAPRVHVSAARADRSWIFSVRDNGIGIDAEHTGRIFQLFQRLHTQDRYPGTGIGLAICKKIVERHGGRIWVESMPGTGSTFHFTLSVQPEETGARPAGEIAAAATGLEAGAGGLR